jgi:hypothetical protein
MPLRKDVKLQTLLLKLVEGEFKPFDRDLLPAKPQVLSFWLVPCEREPGQDACTLN